MYIHTYTYPELGGAGYFAVINKCKFILIFIFNIFT